MKVCIVTVYNSINSGSFWQAKTLGIKLEEMGIDVYYFQRNNDNKSSSSKLQQFKKVIKKLLKYGVKEAINQIKIYSEFNKAQKDFKVIKKNNKIINEIDSFILGSDTIWNLDSAFFAKNYEIYFGGIFEKEKVISYAASAANTSLDTIKKYKKIPEMLENMTNISVRDNETLKIIKELTTKEVELVCDPTLLLTKEDYQKIVPVQKEEKYIFLYLFSPLNSDQIKELKKFANKKGLKIINGLNKDKNYDKNIINTPYEFLNYMMYADYIVTDTFHGTIFSINLEKKFVSIDRNKKKITDFLKICDMTNQLVKEKDSLIKKMEEKIDYSKNDKKELLREKSMEYLIKALNIEKR